MATLSAGEVQALRDKIAQLEAAAATAQWLRPLKCKVGEKGGVVVSGLNAKWPLTLYAAQWERLAEYMPTILGFIASNPGLTRKS